MAPKVHPVLYTDVDIQCNKLVIDDHHQFTTLTIHLNLTAPETSSRSKDMAGAHQNVNSSRDLTTSLSEMVCHRWAHTCYIDQTAKYEVSISIHYEDMKGDT